MRLKIGKWCKRNLLTDDDSRRIEREKDPIYQAKRYRLWWYSHAIIFIILHIFFWFYYGNKENNLLDYLRDLSWYRAVDVT